VKTLGCHRGPFRQLAFEACIAGERLSNSAGLALLINAFATGAGLVALILALGPISGAQFNPAVTL
jgi:glycerol uptake facilitator-like aquaporin